MGNSCFGVAKDRNPKSSGHRIHRSRSSSSIDSCSSSSSGDRIKRHNLVRDGLELLPESKDGVPRFKLVISKEQVDEIVSGAYHPSKIDYLDHLVTTMLREELKKLGAAATATAR